MTRVLLLAVTLLGLSPAVSSNAVVAAPPAARPATTTITLTVRTCGRCVIQPVQTRHGEVTFMRTGRNPNDGTITWRVPNRRTDNMSFLVYAPFDETGYPAVAITRFKTKRVGQRVPDAFTTARHAASGCWAGTKARTFDATLVIKRRTVSLPFSGRRGPAAAAYLRRTVASKPYFYRVAKGSYHSSDPSICR